MVDVVFKRHPLMPMDTPDYMADAWAGCVSWAASNPEIMDQYRKMTGDNYKPATDPISQMVDDATGMEELFCESFTKWVNEYIWGPIDGPKGDIDA